MKMESIIPTKYPFIQGAMAHIATGKFAAAVSNAGGLGVIGSGAMNAQQLEAEILICQSLTDQPFAVNIMLKNPHCEAIVAIIIQHQVPIVTTGAGNPERFIKRLKEAKIKIMPVVPNVRLAKKMAALQVDAVIVEGMEAGGHIGELTTMVLVPQVVRAISIPVIAAGGIATGAQIAACFALGAKAVQVGTCLLVSDDCDIHPDYKQAVIDACDTSTTVVGRLGGPSIRLLNNQMAQRYVQMEQAGDDQHQLEAFAIKRLKDAMVKGDVVNGALMMGQVAGLVETTGSIQTIIEKLFEEASQVINQLKITWPIMIEKED